MAKSQNFPEDSKVWASDPDHPERVFVEAVVKGRSGGKIKLEINVDGEKTTKELPIALPLHARAGDEKCLPEMDDLPDLNEAIVLQNVESLFGKQATSVPGQGSTRIYSSVGPVLIALNPFEPLPIYGQEWMNAYNVASEAKRRELGPHAYRTSAEAYTKLQGSTPKSKSQAVIICGESGAGKTVTNRKMIEYFCEVSKPKSGADASVSPEAITNANAFLEAFGNAKTTRNENSSRFGKLTKLRFTSDSYTVDGCSVDHYLLERSRIVAPNSQERNYHIFYQVLAEDKAKADLDLAGKGFKDFKYLKDTAPLMEGNDATDYTETMEQLKQAGFPDDMVTNIKKVVAAVLHLGNVEFTGDRDKSEVKADGHIEKASKLLEVDPAKLGESLTHWVKTIGKDNIVSPLGKTEAEGQRDAVAKTIYSKLFDQIVHRISAGLSNGGGASGQPEVKLLDIFGFEDMPVNDFEQLFINLTNERIQNIFNQIMFQAEQKAYEAEGIVYAKAEGMDNAATVDLLMGKMITKEMVELKLAPAGAMAGRALPGVVTMLNSEANKKGGGIDEASRKKVDQDFVAQMEKEFGNELKYPSYKVCTLKDSNEVFKKKEEAAKLKGFKAGMIDKKDYDHKKCFLIQHYAGKICYAVNDWVKKNEDSLLDNVADVVKRSGSGFVQGLFEEPGGQADDRPGAAAKKADKTVGFKFKKQLHDLAAELESGEATFVRCIKTTPKQVRNEFDRALVHDQLVNGGVIAALEIRRRGFPYRMDYEEFAQEFGTIAGLRASGKPSDLAKMICETVLGDPEEIQKNIAYGKTKIFMKTEFYSFLKRVAKFRERFTALKVQRNFRRAVGTERIGKLETAWATFQAAEKLAISEKLQGVEIVDSVLAEGKQHIQPMHAILDELTAKSTLSGFQRTLAVSKQLDAADVAKLPHFAFLVQSRVEKTHEFKQEGELMLGHKFQACVDGLNRYTSKVDEIQASCKSIEEKVNKGDFDAAMVACDTALDRCAKGKDELAAIKTEGLGTSFVVLDGTEVKLNVTEENISPKMDRLMADVKALVAKAEESDAKFSQTRKDFEDKTADAAAQFEVAKNQLRIISEQVMVLDAERRGDAEAVLAQAWEQQNEADAAFQASNAEAFIKTVDSFKQTVERARKEMNAKMTSTQKDVQKTPIVDQLFNFYAAGGDSIEGNGYEKVIRQLTKMAHQSMESRGGVALPESTIRNWIVKVVDPDLDGKITKEEASFGFTKVMHDIDTW